ncbi:hypothetical protein AB0M46_39390 [Dactylosporangium sp. NPDC051485]|uniref:hypothetical protein n=1 Tax=Dactylosporangium sp. NPDC051485 TaxID=3154846 RepID=UPI0034453AC9
MGETTQRCGLPRMPRAAAVWVPVLICAALLTAIGGCARSGQSSVGTADVAGEPGGLGVSCTDPGFAPVAGPSAAEPGPQPLPTGFAPVSASRCVFSVATVPGDGEWQMRDEQQADGGLDALAAALRQPSEDNPGTDCPAIAIVPVVITLVDAHGRKVVPALPHQACGMPLPSVEQAIRALPWRSVSQTKVRQTRSQLEVSSGCSGKYKPVIAIEAAEGSTRSPDAAPFDPGKPPAALAVCRYRLDPADTISGANPSVAFQMGVLSSATTLSGAALSRFVTAVHAAPPVTTRCAQPQAPFAIVFVKDTGPYLMVELGGCYRADDGNGTLRQLDAAAVALLTA